MKKQLKLLSALILLGFSFLSNQVWGQVSIGGTPPSFSKQKATSAQQSAKQSPEQTIPLIDLPITFDVEKLLAEDIENEAYGHPPRVGVLIPTNDLNFATQGKWTVLEDGQYICQLAIRAEGARALSLYYKQFYIPKGGKLYIYNKDRTNLIGAFTNDNNVIRQAFATEYTAGDELIMEYVAPPAEKKENRPNAAAIVNRANPTQFVRSQDAATEAPTIIISSVGYGYSKYVVITNKEADEDGLLRLNESGSCEVNINCPEGADWQIEKNSVARLVIPTPSGQALCTGTLIHNTSRDFSPYIISAFHCFRDATVTEIQQTAFYFNFEQQGCANTVKEPERKTIVGATMLVNIPIMARSDGSLLMLNERVPEDYGLYWSGWDRRNEPMASGVGIHHPKGDAMKISTVPPGVTRSGYWKAKEDSSARGAHWELTFINTISGYGVVEEGSSGSGLFNQDKRLVGTLTGGACNCTNPTATALYGKLWYHWDQSPEPELHMATYLDPINSGEEFIDGEFLTGAFSANFNATARTVYAGEEVFYIDQSYGEITAWNWEFPGGVPETSTDKNPVVVYYTPGTYSAKLTISYEEDGESKTLVRERNDYITVTQKAVFCPEDSITIGAGTAVSEFPLGATGVQAYSASIYAKNNFNRSGSIAKLAWNASVASNTARKVSIYMKEVNDSTFAAADTWDNIAAGATLVLDNADVESIAAGWKGLKLTAPFAYSGTKHLMVLVRTVASAAPYESSACYYSEKSNAHMQWVASDEAPITGAGTLNNQLPNIRVGFAEGDCGRLPEASFEILGDPFFKESFDALTLPEGWEVTKPGNSPSKWMLGNLVTAPFNIHDPNNIYSAAISPGETNYPVDSWLISKAVKLPEKTTNVQFYIGYNPRTASVVPLVFYVSTDGKKTWEEVWRSPSGNAEWGWYKMVRSIQQYSGKEVHFAWRVYGTGGDFITLDQIQIFEDKAQVNIYEGESVSYIDRSSGPPIYWKWDLQGGMPATSAATAVQSVYLHEGQYDSKLYVRNNIGADSVTLEKAIIVSARTPVARIASANGYIRTSNHNRFIPKGATIVYTDTSLYVPKSWNWEFDGGIPATSTDRKVSVQYPAEGEFSTKLTAGNVKGSDDTLVADYVKVGGTDRIWNMPAGDFGEAYYPYGGEGEGLLTGLNSTRTEKYAEAFAAPQEPISLSKIEIMFVIDGKKRDADSLRVGVYTCQPGANPQPQKLLASKALSIAEITSESYTVVEFPEPVIVTGKYFIVVEGFSKLKTSMAIMSSELIFDGRNSAFACQNEVWYSMKTYIGSGIGLALNIAPTITYTRLVVTSPERYTIPFDDISPKAVTVESNVKWTASSAQPWISVSSPEGNGNGSFTFTCAPSIETIDRHGVIVVSGGGKTNRIYITQTTGDSVVGLTANLLEDYISVQLNWDGPAASNASSQSSGVMLPNIVKASAPIVKEGHMPMSGRVEAQEPDYRTYSAAQSLSWAKPPVASFISYSAPKNYQVASLFYPEDIAQYHGGELSMFEFYPYSLANFRLLIYQNEELVLDSLLTDVNPRMYNQVDISAKGIIIDATKSLRLTMDIVAAANARAMTLDAGPPVAGKGNLLNNNMNNEWAPYSDFPGNETKGNWMIGAYVKMQDAPTNYYKIYRNGKKIAETDKTNFVDKQLQLPNTYCYTVTKVSNADNKESEKSNEACVTVKPVVQAIASNLSIDYGSQMPTSEYLSTLYGMWNPPSLSIVSGPVIKLRDDITSKSPAGTYSGGIEISDLVLENADMYNIIYVSGSMRINPRPVTITANENTQKEYGNPDPNPIPYAVTNIVEGDSLIGALSRKAGENAGAYLLEKGTLNNANNPNYQVNMGTGAQFTITPRPVTVIPDAAGKTYGDPEPAVYPYTVQNGAGNESLKGLLMREPGEESGEYNITQGQVDNVRNPNYDIKFRTGRKFMVSPREMTVTPDAMFKEYGTPDTVITYKTTGLLHNETLTGALARAEGENAGQYPVTAGDLSAGNNYRVKVNPALFTILPAKLAVRADNLAISVGSLLPKPTYTMTGYKAEDEPGLRSIIDNSIYINADRRPAAGVYDILFGSHFYHKNYDATFAPAQLTVSGTPVTAFIPGSADPRNATFMPEGATNLKVFSRNGAVVYDGANPWDGHNKQGKVEAGIYYYIATMADGSTVKGSVEVYNL